MVHLGDVADALDGAPLLAFLAHLEQVVGNGAGGGFEHCDRGFDALRHLLAVHSAAFLRT